jgi:hypothetical protein
MSDQGVPSHELPQHENRLEATNTWRELKAVAPTPNPDAENREVQQAATLKHFTQLSNELLLTQHLP